MFALKSLSKYLFSAGNKESLVEIPEGKLYLVRPNSLKGASELIFKDSVASIRRTAKQFHYQLVIQRAYEEGEAELLEDDGDSADPDDPNFRPDRDERTFLLHEDLRFRGEISETGECVFAWNDLSGDPGDVFEFVCEASVKPETAASFSTVAAQCQFERKYQLPQDKATEKQLQEFQYTGKDPIPQASPITSPTRSPRLSPVSHSRPFEAADVGALEEAVSTHTQPPGRSREARTPGARTSAAARDRSSPPAARALTAPPPEVEAIVSERAELHMFDVQSGTFILQSALVTAKISDLGGWKYWLRIASSAQEWLGLNVDGDLNPVFNFEYLSFIFNRQDADGRLSSWLLRFNDHETIDRFQEGFARALWEHNNCIKWAKAGAMTHDFVLDSLADLAVEEDDREAEAREEDEAIREREEELDGEGEDGDGTSGHARFGRSHDKDDGSDDDDDDDDEIKRQDADGHVNSQLAVGARHDRSFVVRGSKLGVFKHTTDNRLEFDTNISKIMTPQGKLFSPNKVMLHEGDTHMVLGNDDNPNALYRMDLEYGKVVDEWKIDDNIPVKTFAPSSKFSQLTGEQTFVGLSNNSLFRVDPRQAGHKLVNDQLKTYASKTGFAAAATTDKGYIAVASNNGEIRLFDRIGINAKSQLPSIGDPVIGLDVSADGRWVLGTTRTYILLIDSLHGAGKHEGEVGFKKGFAADAKPRPRKLQIKPEHSQQFQHETGKPLSFTTARFNTGEGKEESTIVTSTGPFIVTWSLKKLLRGIRDPYSIKRYDEDIMADNFRYGSDKNIVVALPNEVGMVARRALKRPTRESIMATPKRGSRQSHLRDEIVNSPY